MCMYRACVCVLVLSSFSDWYLLPLFLSQVIEPTMQREEGGSIRGERRETASCVH